MKATTDTTNQIIEYMTLQGHLAWRTSAAWVSGTGYLRKAPKGSLGIGDINGLLNRSGIHFEIDTKTAGDKASEVQINHATEVRRRGGLTFFSATFDDFARQWTEYVATGKLPALPEPRTARQRAGDRFAARMEMRKVK